MLNFHYFIRPPVIFPGDVLFALSKNAKAKQSNSGKGMQHVPYLNYKLTQLLRNRWGATRRP